MYTLHVKADNTFDIYIDAEKASSGNLLEDFEPSVNPDREIPDPDDEQPDDWVTQVRHRFLRVVCSQVGGHFPLSKEYLSLA